MTHRLGVARALLRGQSIEPTFAEHDEECMLSPAQRLNRIPTFNYRCSCGASQQPPTWPEWVTDETFELAYRLADEIQTRRGDHLRAQAARAKAGA